MTCHAIIWQKEQVENYITIFHWDFLLRGGGHDLDVTRKLQFQLFITLHVSCDSGISTDWGDKKLDLQHTFPHGLQTEKCSNKLANLLRGINLT